MNGPLLPPPTGGGFCTAYVLLDVADPRLMRSFLPQLGEVGGGHNSYAPCMIPWCWLLLLVARLVLLVDDDEAEILEGQEDGRAGSQDDIVGMGRELLLPDLDALGIAVFGMIDAQAVAEDAMQSLHDLHRQRDLGQEIEHLSVLLYLALDEVNVDLGLSAGGDAMQEGDVAARAPLAALGGGKGRGEKREEHLVVGLLLCGAHLLDELRMRLAAAVEAAHLHLVGLEHAALDELVEHGQGGSAGVHQLLAGDLEYGFKGGVALDGVPSRQREIGNESLLLTGRACQQIECYVQRGLVLVGGREPDIGLGAGLVAFLCLQARRQRCLHHFADGRHVVVGYPLPLPELTLEQDGPIVHQQGDGLHLIALGLDAVEAADDAHIALRPSEGYEHTHAPRHLPLQLARHRVGEQCVERQGQDDVGKGGRWGCGQQVGLGLLADISQDAAVDIEHVAVDCIGGM